MSNNNLLQGYTWDGQYDDPQPQFPRPIQDEVISVYEVYVKEETVGSDGRSDISIVSGEPSSSSQLMQGDCLDLDAAIGSEVIDVDSTISKLLGKDAVKYKILEQNVNEENVVMYSHPVSETPSATTRLVDKDDPRSRLHFVKYLKRDGKTLKIWECGICSKEFRHQYTLMRHLPTHTDERNFKCEACGKAFRQLSTLSQHRAIHSDARPYVCEFCKKTFNRVSTLISHRKTHSEHKPHKCHMCGKGFHQKGNLRNHVFTHTNERPYKCEICGKGFNQMSNLMCHKVKAHAHAEKMQYVCGICGKEFPRRFSLRSHEEYKHGIKYRHPNAPVVLQDTNEPGVVRNKNVSIVSLTNGERPMICDVGNKENLNPGGYTGSVIVDKIETKAMENAILEGQTPFALFKPAKGIPVLVKVSSCPNSANRKQMLTPATAEDLRMAGKMTVSPTLADVDGVKAVQIKVPVVATVTQRIEPDGSCSFLIEPPGPEQEQESLIEPIGSRFSCPDNNGLGMRGEFCKNSQDHQTNSGSGADCSDLLELAAQGGIQFVRATEDGRYEVMTNSEARDLMAQNSHDVTILDGPEAEAISAGNLRGQQQSEQISSHSQNQEIIIGDSNNQITVLNSGSNSSMQKNNNPLSTDGIEILGEKDIRILQNSKNFDNEDGRFGQNGSGIFEHDKIEDFSCGGKELGTIWGHDNLRMSNHQNLTHVLGQNSLNKNLQPPMNSFFSKNPTGVSLLNHNYQSFKHNNTFCDGISTILSSGDHSIVKNQPVDISTKLKVSDFDTIDNLNAGITQTEVKILGAKNSQSKVKILGHSLDKMEIEKVLNFGNPPASNDTVKILGAKNPNQFQGDYKDLKILGSSSTFCSYDQFNGGINQRKDQVKTLGKKKDPIHTNVSNENNGAGFEVKGSSILIETGVDRVPETIVIRDSPEIRGSHKSADFLQAGSKIGEEAEDCYIREFEGTHHLNAFNDLNRISSFDDVIYIEDNIKNTISTSERDFDITGHCHPARYYDLPDLD